MSAFQLPNADEAVKQKIKEAIETGDLIPNTNYILYEVPGVPNKRLKIPLSTDESGMITGSITTAYPISWP